MPEAMAECVQTARSGLAVFSCGVVWLHLGFLSGWAHVCVLAAV